MNKKMRTTFIAAITLALFSTSFASHAQSAKHRSCTAVFAGEADAVQGQPSKLPGIGEVLLVQSKNWANPHMDGAAVEFDVETDPLSFTVAINKVEIEQVEAAGNLMQVPHPRQLKRNYVMPWNSAKRIDGPDGKTVVEVECKRSS